MGKKPDDTEVSDKEAEQRATDALRRALTTPYKPQSALKGRPVKKAEPRRRKLGPSGE